MGFKEILQKLSGKNEELKEEQNRRRIQRILDTRELSSNERELMKFQDKEREEQIKEALEHYREREKEDVTFNHNALNAPTIMKSEWKVLKNKNLFKGKSNILNNGNSMMKAKSIFMR